jgi:hypothetical protein
MDEVIGRVVGEKQILVECLAPERKGIGQYKFCPDPDYQYPVAYMPEEMATRLINSEVRDKTNNFRRAVEKKKTPAGKAKKE